MAKIVVSFKRSLLRLGILAGVGKDHEIAGAFRFDIRGGRVTCYLDDIRPLRNFGEGQRLEATFTTGSVMELTPDLVGPSITRNSGIIGERVDLSLDHDDMRQSSLVFHVTKRLLYTKSRDPGEEPKLHLFGQLKRITKEWLDKYLVCKGGTYPGLLMYQELADMVCNRITAAITLKHIRAGDLWHAAGHALTELGFKIQREHLGEFRRHGRASVWRSSGDHRKKTLYRFHDDVGNEKRFLV